MHVIESIGPLLGIAAFLGLAVLAFLLFQQSRDIRRLREWAGRAPERAQEAADAVQTAAEASRGDAAEEASPQAAEGRLAWVRAAWGRAIGRLGEWLRSVDRRLPVDGRYLLRMCIVNFRTTLTDVESLPALIAELGAGVWESMKKESLV